MSNRCKYLTIVTVPVLLAVIALVLWFALPEFSGQSSRYSFAVTLLIVALSSSAISAVAMGRFNVADKERVEQELEQLNRELQYANASLDQRVMERTAELVRLSRESDQARGAAEEASRSKSIFLSNMSHEIRTPMNVVLGLSQLALQTELTEKQRDYLSKINGSVQGLLEIINDIPELSAARFGEGSGQSRLEEKQGRADLAARYQCLKGLAILVAEDHPVNRLIVQETLEAVGIQVLLAQNGKEAVEQVMQYGDELDMVLMDIQMPIMDGFQACREIRGRYNQSQLPVVAMTAHVMTSEREQCLDAGMNEHLAKPVAVEQLYTVIAAMSGRTAAVVHDNRDICRDTAQQASFPQHLPGIRLQEVRQRVNGNVRLLGQLICMFAREHGGTTAELARLMELGEPLSAARLLHGLKGVAGNLAAQRLHHAALELEMALREEDLPHARRLLDPFDEALQEVCSGAELIKESFMPDASPAMPLSALQAGVVLSELQQLLETHSLAAAEWLERLAGLLSADDQALLVGMREAVQKLEYEKALVLVHELAGRYAACAEELP